MYYIDNYREEAINKLVPYLISFPDIVKLTENSADRYQAIEDVLWKIATNFRLVDSRGIFLDTHAHNEVVELIYTDKARDAFTYGATWTQEQFDNEDYNPRVFGTGKFYSQASYLSGVPKNVSEEKLIRAVQEKIIQNNTTGIIEDFIEAMKLHFNATRVQVFEAYPLAVTLVLSGDKLELSSSGDKDAIKKCLPACVQLKDFYINDNKFDPFIYRIKSDYAMDSRYPIMLGDTDYIYQYKSVGINLNSTDEEYIIINNPFSNVNLEQNTPFECITGEISELNNNATILSIPFSLDNESYKISIKIKQISEDYYFYLIKEKWDENNSVWVEQTSVDTAIKAEINKDFTILLTINKQGYDFAKLWIFNGVKIFGQTSSQDISWAYNIIQNDPNYKTVQINTEEIPSPLAYDNYAYINTFFDEYNEIKTDFADFTYYAIVGGEIDTNSNIILDDKAHYYVTCFGEKNILFNCLTNNNHTIIYTNNTLQSNLTVEQGSYNYKKWHSNGRYLNIKGISGNVGISWENNILANYIMLSSPDVLINSFELSMDICFPLYNNIMEDILNGLLGKDYSFKISFYHESVGSQMRITIPTFTSGNVETPYVINKNIPTGYFERHFNNLKLKYKDNIFYVYIDNTLITTEELLNINIKYLNTMLELGPVNAFVRNFKFNSVYTENLEEKTLEYDIPLKINLYETNDLLQPNNINARFLTVPQLIDNKTNQDIFNGTTIREF